MVSDAHQRLRDATQVHHERLEDRIGILRRIATSAGRRGLVERFHGLHAEAEAALAPWLADLPGLDFDARRRSRVLTEDLAVVAGRSAPRAGDPIAIKSVSHGLGLMYVLEGSTLGGRVIRKHVQAAGQDMAGLSFLDPYGDLVGPRWKAFLAVLDARLRTSADVDAAVAGAVAGFGHAERRLCEETVDV